MPLECATGQRPDISALLMFHFWEPVYFALDEEEGTSFPSKSSLRKGWYAGIAKNAGNVMCCKIITADTEELIPWSRVISAGSDFQHKSEDLTENDIEMGRVQTLVIKSLPEDQNRSWLTCLAQQPGSCC